MLRVRVCGGVQIEARGRRLPGTLLPGRQGRLVLAYLVCERHRAVPRDALADLLWADRLPESWATSLSAIVSKLRRLLAEAGLDPATALVSSAGGYHLVLPADTWVDWEVAQRDIDTADRALLAGDHRTAIAAATEAQEVADRGFLAESGEWVDVQRAAVDEVGVRASLALAEGQLLAGSPARAAEGARAAVARDPFREAGYRVLMRALAAAGERGEALRVWERCRTTLVEELGVDPSPDTEAVYLDILGGESARPLPTPLPSGVVTFVLTDIVDSTVLWDRDAPAMARSLERHDTLIADAVARHGGALLKHKLEGDATVSVFARATAAVHAAIAVREALAAEPWPDATAPTVRTAVHTGEAFEREGDYFGPALNRAARLRALASSGQILLSQAAAELVVDHLPADVRIVDLGHRDLRGLSRGENVSMLEITSGDTGEPAAAAAAVIRPPIPPALTSVAPFVGRDEELARLEGAFDRALTGAPRAVLLAGEPGVGKSRLAAEWAARAHGRGAAVLYGRCEEGLGAPLQPFVEALRSLVPHVGAARVRQVHGIEGLGRLVPELAELLPGAGAPPADPDSERYVIFDAVTRLLTNTSAEAPVLLVLDDLHWAGKTTLTLLRHLLRHAQTGRLLVVGTYRDTELGRTHPLAAMLADLHRDGTAERVTVTGLGPDDVSAYLRAVGHEDPALGTELVKVTSGNPFFLIEAVRHVEESGGTWDPGTLPQGVREATGRRLSRLSEDANRMLRVAAVAGASFSLELVEQVHGAELVDEITEACDAGLVMEEPGGIGTFRFAHALVRQVLLAELVTVKRLRLHRTIAELLEAAGPGHDPDTHLSELAHHWFECASAGNAPMAVTACRLAADRAMERLAFDEAGELYDMALQALEADGAADETRADLLVARCEALLAAGSATPARATLDELQAHSAGVARVAARHAILAGELAVLAEPDRLVDVVAAMGDATVALRHAADVAGEAKAHYVHALALERLGRIGEAEQALDQALVAARACGDRRLADAVLAAAPHAALWGPSPVARASGRCLDVVRVLRITQGAPAVEAVALECQAALEALRGRMDAARRMIAAARQTVEQLGLAHRLLETEIIAGIIELLDGRAAAAEAHLRPALAGLRDRGLDGEAAHAAALLGRALLEQGRDAEAEVAAEEAARLGGADLRASIYWRGVLALTAAGRGDRDRALRLAREAVDLASGTDALLVEADARLALAGVLRALGEADAARAESRRAAEVCDRKGATALAALARLEGKVRPEPATLGPPAREQRRVGADRATELPRVGRWAPLVPQGGRRDIPVHFNARDWGAYTAAFRPDVTIVDNRSGREGRVYGLDEFLPQVRYAFDATTLTLTATVVATRGERLDLGRTVYTGEWGASGTSELEFWAVTEVDEEERVARLALFDGDRFDAAYELLDVWYAESRAPSLGSNVEFAQLARLYSADDWDALEALCAPELVVHDHRLAAPDAVRSRDEWLASARSMRATLAHGMRTLHLRERRRSALVVISLIGAVDDEFVSVAVHDAAGRICRLDLYGEEELDSALARYDALAGGSSEPAFANAAWRAAGVPELVATRGDRLALVRGRDDVGASLVLVELDEDGAIVARRAFPDDATDAAYEELDERYARGDAAAHASSWSVCRDRVRHYGDLRSHRGSLVDHRPASLGAVSPEEWNSVGDRWAVLAPDVRVRLEHVLTLTDAATLSVVTTEGIDREGGAWEVRVVALWRCGTTTDDDHTDLYALDQLAEARARFDEIVAASTDPFRNSVDEALAQFTRGWDGRDWGTVAVTFAPGFTMHDRRSMAPWHADATGSLELIRARFDDTSTTAWRFERRASRGTRLGLYRETHRFSSDGSGPAESTWLAVVEVDSDGHIEATVLFDEDALDAAYDELDDRFARGEAAAFPRWAREREIQRAYNRDHWASTPFQVSLHDHRRSSLGVVSVDDLGTAREAWAPLSPEVRVRWDHVLAVAENAMLTALTVFGTTADGGPWEAVQLTVDSWDEATDTEHVDVYDRDQLADARARFEQVVVARRDPFRNGVDDAMDRFVAAWRARDWAALAANWSPAFRVDNRQMLSFWTAEQALQAVRTMFEDTTTIGWDFERLATRGQRLALHRQTYRFSQAGSGPAELVHLAITDIEPDGTVRANVVFDEADLAAAFAELDDRYEKDEAAPLAAVWRAAREPGSPATALGWRVDHALDICERGALLAVTWVDDAAGESQRLVVTEIDTAGRVVRRDVYELDEFDAARVRFAELAGRIVGRPDLSMG